MYQRIVAMRRKVEKLRCMLVVPFCFFMGLGAFKLFGGVSLFDRIFKWVLWAAVWSIGAYTFWDYLHFDRDLEKMKRAVGALSDAEMSALMERSTNFDDAYFISDACVLNFAMLNAYLLSEIRLVESYEHTRTDSDGNSMGITYCLSISYGEKSEDRMEFSSAEKRSEARKLLKNRI